MDDAESRPEGSGERWYSVLGGGRGCGHRHWSLVAAAVCLRRRLLRSAALGCTAWDIRIAAGPDGAPLTVDEQRILTLWEQRGEEDATARAAPDSAGLLRRVHELLREGLDAAASKAIELVAEIVEQQPGAQEIAAKIRQEAGEVRADAVRFAALLPDAAERQRLERLAAERKWPKRAQRWARDVAGSA